MSETEKSKLTVRNAECATPIEVAALLKIPVRAVYRLIKTRRITAIRVCRKLRILSQDLDEFLKLERERGA